MIQINHATINNIIVNHASINAIYNKGIQIWNKITGFLSCFNNASGSWDDSLPWDDDVIWQD